MHSALFTELFELEAFLECFFVLMRVVVHFIAGFAGKSHQIILRHKGEKNDGGSIAFLGIFGKGRRSRPTSRSPEVRVRLSALYFRARFMASGRLGKSLWKTLVKYKNMI